MNSVSMRRRDAALDLVGRVDWNAVWTWMLGFGLVVYLGLKGGGFDPLVHDRVGIVVWWVLLAAVLVGAAPRMRIGPLAWSAAGLLLCFALWTALSLIWTESSEQTLAEVALLVGYLGIFSLALASAGPETPRRLAAAVAAAIALVALVALASRLHPTWFSAADRASWSLLESERLSYPLNYWNGLAALLAMGLPLLAEFATAARRVWLRGLAAAAIPALILTIFFTLSRGGIAAAAIGLIVFIAFASERLPRLATLALTGVGGALLIVAADGRAELREGLFGTVAGQQGDEMLAIVVVVCIGVGLAQALLSLLLGGERRPRWTRVPRRAAAKGTAAAAVALLVVAVAVDAPGRVADGWDEFKDGGGPGSGTGRLSSTAGQNRYQFWSATVRENAETPLLGTGAGTFEFWWARDGDSAETVVDAHSLYLQTLGELGVVGLLLLFAFLTAVLVGGVRRILVADRDRSLFAAALAACLVLCVTAAVDWMWQIPVLPVSFLLLASVLLAGGARSASAASPPRLALGWRLAFIPAALLALATIAIPLTSTDLVRQSEAQFRRGDLPAALKSAKSAENVEPGAATPLLQQALVLEAGDDLAAASAAARSATAKESTNWRTWLVLSRIEAQRGRAAASVAAYRRARSLNPRSSLFAG